MQMIRFGFNLLLFVVLLILFVGYCWAIKIDRDYNAKIEKFNNNTITRLESSQDPFMNGSYNNSYLYGTNTYYNTSNQLTPNYPLPLDLNSSLSTPEKALLEAYLLRQKNKDEDENVCENNNDNNNNGKFVLQPSQIPSVANMNNDPWKQNSLNIPFYPDDELLKPYTSAKNTPPLLMSLNDNSSNINNNLYKVNVCNDANLPLNANNIIAFNDDLEMNNSGSQPWQHHRVQRSIPDNPIVKFKHAFYYEFDNILYLRNIKAGLAVPCDLLTDAVLTSNWSTIIDPAQIDPSNATLSEVTDGYNNCLQFISTKINNSKYMILPADINIETPSQIQIVHDIFKSYKIHNTSTSMYLINMELILYRLSKYNGKHVDVICTAKKINTNWVIHVVSIRILGIVPEEDIGLYPVTPVDQVSVPHLPVVKHVNGMTAMIYYNKSDSLYKNQLNARNNEYSLIDATNNKIANLQKGATKYNQSNM